MSGYVNLTSIGHVDSSRWPTIFLLSSALNRIIAGAADVNHHHHLVCLFCLAFFFHLTFYF